MATRDDVEAYRRAWNEHPLGPRRTALPGGMKEAVTRWVQLGVIEPQEEQRPFAALCSPRTEVRWITEADLLFAR